jgi:hypothetical protein
MNRLIVIIITVLTCSTKSFTQSIDLTRKVDSLRYLGVQPFDCNSLYWQVVKGGKEAIPLLIARLNDNTPTKVSLNCKRTDVKVGDVCYEVLTEIFEIPTFFVTRLQFDFVDQNGCQHGLYQYFASDRLRFKKQILDYYQHFKDHIVFVKYGKDYKNNCKLTNKILGYYQVEEKFLKCD